MMVNVRYFVLVCIASASCFQAHAGQVQAKSASQALQHSNMKLINSFFGSNPRIMISLQKSSAIAKRTLHELATIKDSEVAARLDLVLKPGEFFLSMLDGEVGSFIDPLIVESLGKDGHEKSIFGAMTKQQGSPVVFLKDRIKTKEDLKQFCHEFIKFFNDLHHSLSPEVRVIVAEETKRLIALSRPQHPAK